jgi:hypothetical protein
MAVFKNDRVEVLQYLKQSIQRLRDEAQAQSGAFGDHLREIADQIAKDTAALEAEMIEAGYLLKPAGEA